MFNKEFRKQVNPFPPLPAKIPSDSSPNPPTQNNNMEEVIDLNELIRNKTATVFFRMKGDAMRDAGIFDHDLLIVDRFLKPVNGKIIVAILNGELLVRRFHKNFTSAFLIPENNRYKPINLAEFSDFAVRGVVTYVIHAL